MEFPGSARPAEGQVLAVRLAYCAQRPRTRISGQGRKYGKWPSGTGGCTVSAIAEANSTVSWFARADRTLNSRPEALEVAVEVSGTRATEAGAARELFAEATHTTLVFADGAVVRLSAAVAVGQLLFVRNERTQREIVTRVLKQRRISPSSAYVEVEFTDAAPDFWSEDLALAAAGANEASSQAAGHDGHGSDAVGDVTSAAQNPDLSESPFGEGALDSYELLNDTGVEAGAAETVAAGHEFESNASVDGPSAEEAAPEPSFAKPDETEVMQLRTELDGMRAQMSMVLENTHAVAKRRTPDASENQASESAAPGPGKVSDDFAQLFASLCGPASNAAPSSEHAPMPEPAAVKKEAGKKEAFAPPIVANPAVTPEEFARELEKLNRARKLGLTVEELEDEDTLAAAKSATEATTVAKGEVAMPEETVSEEDGDGASHKATKAKKPVVAIGVSGDAAGGNSNTARIALIAALLMMGLLGGGAYWKGWIGAHAAGAEGANAAVAPRAGNGILRPAASKLGADGAGASQSNDTTAEDNARAARENDAAVLRGARAASGEGANGQPARSNSATEQAKYRQAAAKNGGAVASTVEEAGDGYEPPKLVKAVNAVPPPEAVQNFVTGDVKFNALIDEGGKVESAEVLSGPEALRAAAREALKKYQYKPAVKNGQPVAGHVVVAVKFWYEP
jgi:TonB family protein